MGSSTATIGNGEPPENWIGALLLGAAREKRRHFRRDKTAPAEPWRGEAAGVGIHGRGTRYNTLQPNMPSKFATRTAWASRGASFLGHPPAFPYAPRNCNLH